MRHRRARLLSVALVPLALVVGGPAAAAPVSATPGWASAVAAAAAPKGAVDTGTVDLDAAAASLRQDPVYVDPAAERALSAAEADELRDRIRNGGHPVFVAVLPAAVTAATSADVLPAMLGERIGLRGTVAVVAGDSFRAASNVLPRGQAGSLATTAFQGHAAEGTVAVLDAFVDAAARAGSQPSSRSGSSSSQEAGSGTYGISWFPIVVVVGLGVGLWAWLRRRRRQREEAEQRAAISGDLLELRAHVDVLASPVLDLDGRIGGDARAAEEHRAAVQRYRLAEAALGNVRGPEDVARVRRLLSEADYAAARTRAVVDGRPVPLPPADLAQPGPNREPAIALDDERQPVYVGGAGMAPMGWYGPGWFPGTGLLTGVMLGSILGGGWGFGGWGGGWGGGGWGGGDGSGGDGSGGFDGGSGAEWGGGDWGGGFGGGDFGGDIGGGDWG